MSDSGRIWLIKVSEPLPLPGAKLRLMRTGQIAERLLERQADVTWWVSDFNHAEKRYHALDGVAGPDRAGYLANGVFARFLHGRPYKRNVSLARIFSHRDEARDFAVRARALPPPQAILCSYPTIDLAHAATAFGKERGIPVILDVRDLWPDIFLAVSPLPEQLTRALIAPMMRKAHLTLRDATAISAISEPILDWALAKAGRPRGEIDRVVTLSYERATLTDEARATEEASWRARGLKLDGSEYIACFFGNLSSAPEFETVVEAIDHLPENIRVRTRIVICGAGERLAWLQAQAARRPELLAPGHIGAAAINTLMRHATAGLLIYPSRPDFLISYPNKIGEYLSAGLPILSTVDGLAGRLLREENCGLVVANRDAKALAAAFAGLATDRVGWLSKSAAARRVFARMFDAEKVYGEAADHLLTLGEAGSSG
jgi:glycosyltransferase involved in cell wall biosynthesis